MNPPVDTQVNPTMADSFAHGNVARPGPVDLTSNNIQRSWEEFKQKFGFYLTAIRQKTASPDVKFALLMGEAGPGALAVYNSFRAVLPDPSFERRSGEIEKADFRLKRRDFWKRI